MRSPFLGQKPLKIVFMGTPSYATPVLDAVIALGHEVVGVFTQPDRPSGRGKRTVAPDVKLHAKGCGIKVYQPESLKQDVLAYDQVTNLRPDLIIVAAYGLILPHSVLTAPSIGCLNLHPSLLPRYRGPSPVSTAILNGEKVTGVTIIEMDEYMDTGPIVAQREIHIGTGENAENLTARLFTIGAELLAAILTDWVTGEIQTKAQDHTQMTLTKRISKEHGRIDWGQSAEFISRQIRAYHPWPGTFTMWKGRHLKVIQGCAIEPGLESKNAGYITMRNDGNLAVVTGQGLLELRLLQQAGRKIVTAKEFLYGNPDFRESVLNN